MRRTLLQAIEALDDNAVASTIARSVGKKNGRKLWALWSTSVWRELAAPSVERLMSIARIGHALLGAEHPCGPCGPARSPVATLAAASIVMPEGCKRGGVVEAWSSLWEALVAAPATEYANQGFSGVADMMARLPAAQGWHLGPAYLRTYAARVDNRTLLEAAKRDVWGPLVFVPSHRLAALAPCLPDMVVAKAFAWRLTLGVEPSTELGTVVAAGLLSPAQATQCLVLTMTESPRFYEQSLAGGFLPDMVAWSTALADLASPSGKKATGLAFEFRGEPVQGDLFV